HLRDSGSRRASRLGLADFPRLLAEARADTRMVMMIVLGGATSFFVGNAFQAQMPEYAHHLGTDDAGTRYSLLLAANAVGAITGAVLLESAPFIRLSARTVIGCAAVWGVLMALFPVTPSYPTAVVILVLAGVFNIAVPSMAENIIPLLAPPPPRGRRGGGLQPPIAAPPAGRGRCGGVFSAALAGPW